MTAKTAKEELLEFLNSLTEEQVTKLFNHFEELSSLPAESSPPCRQEPTLQNQ